MMEKKKKMMVEGQTYAKLATVGQIGLQSNQGEVDVDLHKDP